MVNSAMLRVKEEPEDRHSSSAVAQLEEEQQERRLSFPVGYVFLPKDAELLLLYLRPMILGRRLPCGAIRPVDIYACNLYQLTKLDDEYMPRLKGKYSYFFTFNDTINGRRSNRITRDGYWKASCGDINVLLGSQIIGFKKSLNLYIGKGKTAIKSNFIMHEFRLNLQILSAVERHVISNSEMKNCVACRIRNKKDYRGTKEKNVPLILQPERILKESLVETLEVERKILVSDTEKPEHDGNEKQEWETHGGRNLNQF